jgi:hypothetical protein
VKHGVVRCVHSARNPRFLENATRKPYVAVGLMCASYYRRIAGAMAKAGIIVIVARLLGEAGVGPCCIGES